MLQSLEIFYFVFGAITLVGGVMGYVKAHSKPSLIAGGLCGVLLIVAGLLLATQPSRHWGLVLGLIVSASLAGKFLPHFLTKKTIFPAGLMAFLGIASIILTILAWYKK